MSWPILLAEYPRSIFESKLPVVVLAILERSGLTTEEELTEQVKVEKKELLSTLLDLHHNELIVFGRNTVRISDRGKTLLDRFRLYEGIIEDLLDALSLRGNERDAYRKVVLNYRDNAFPQYLNSLCTMRTWKTLTAHIPQRGGTKKEREQESKMRQLSERAGLFTILLRDLRNWWINASPPDDIFETLSDQIRKVITDEEPNYKLHFRYSGNVHSKALGFLQILQAPSDERIHYIVKKGEAPVVRALIILDGFQRGKEKDDWYDHWCDASPKVLKESKSTIRFLNRLEHTLPMREPQDGVLRFHHVDFSGSSSWWQGYQRNDLSSDFLMKLMLAPSISRLSSMTNMSEDKVVALITKIQQQCTDLLSAPSDNKNKEEFRKE
jgi:hypothetical protein